MTGVAELKSCPFCGEECAWETDEMIVEPGNGARLKCTNPACETIGPWAQDEATAIAKWNRRPSPAKEGAEGWVTVPREPTEDMLKAAEREWDGRLSARCCGVWQAMISASPPPPSDLVRELVEVLEPFAKAAETIGVLHGCDIHPIDFALGEEDQPTIGDLFRARSALQRAKGGEQP